MRKYKNKIAAAVIIAVVLTFAYWWGGNSPELHGWKPQPKDAMVAQTNNSEEKNLDLTTEKAEIKEEDKKESVESVFNGKTEQTENKKIEETETKAEAENSENSTVGNGGQKETDSATEKAEIKEEDKKESVESVFNGKTEQAENQIIEKTETKAEAENSEKSTAENGGQKETDSATEKAEIKKENESGFKENADFSKEENGQSLDKDGNGNDGAQTVEAELNMPAPVEPENEVISDKQLTCTLSVRCDAILKNIDFLDKEKTELVPKNGVIFAEQTVTFYDGESVFNLLLREMKRNKIHMEFKNTPIYNSAYIEGIANLYEFDCGELSGWMYSVNGWFPNYGCSRYKLKEGDRVEWLYTCNLGEDIGGNYARNGLEKQ